MSRLLAVADMPARLMLCGVIIALSLLMCVVLTAGGGLLSVQQAQQDIGERNAQLAATMRDRLQLNMTERLNDIRSIANILGTVMRPNQSNPPRAVLEGLQKTYPDYAWIGFVDMDGIVLSSTGGLLEGVSAAKRPAFNQATEKPFAGDVHDAVMLGKLLGDQNPSPDPTEPLRLVDASAPVFDSAGSAIGVISSHLYWDWARRTRDHLALLPNNQGALEILVLDSHGRVVLGPTFGEDLSSLASVQAALRGETGHRVETVKGETMVLGYASPRLEDNLVNLGWSVLAMQPTSVAYAPVSRLILWLVGLGASVAMIGGVVAVVLSHRLTQPLVALAQGAEALGRDGQGINSLPRVRGSREIGELSLALRSLLVRLDSSESQRLHAETTLENRIAERTRALEQSLDEVRTLAGTDPLTGTMNRRAFLEQAAVALDQARLQKLPVGMIAIDIDHFKSVNDRYGHATGDIVIRTVAHVARSMVRSGDLVARFGGEEFILLLTGASAEVCQTISERLRQTLECTPIAALGQEINITVSLGCAIAGSGDVALDTLINQADSALYAAKRNGRNQVCLAAA